MFSFFPSLLLIQCLATSIILFTSIIHASFLAKTDYGESSAKEEVYNAKEESVLQCAQRCMFISKDAIMKFDESKMTCLCFRSKDKGAPKANDDEGKKLTVFQKRNIKQFKNHALRKPSRQSTTEHQYTTPNDAKYANDGITTTCSVTKGYLPNEWWVLDLEEVVEIGMIKLRLNQYALGKGYYKKMTILTKVNDTAGWQKCDLVENPTHLIFETGCQPRVSARFVKIRSFFYNPLYLREVEVYDRSILEIRSF